MLFRRVGSSRSRFTALACLVCITAVAVAAAASPAEAARKKKRQAGGYSPPYAAMVVDVKSGRTLHAVNEDALRHPASVTKVMTLYLLFEQLERGRFQMDTPLRVSAHAASRAPSKIGFQPGDTIEVEDAAKALITKSANDVASTVAEAIGGSEEAFAAMMTRKARALGMSRTTFRNASGLPDPEQVTTARDLTILARAIQERFPRYYPMFSTRSFHFAGGTYRNHNKLLGRVEGVDGIKTGYTRASGFNLMTSAKADGRHVVSIVLGGRSGASRDQIMANLVASAMPKATAGGRTSPMIAEAPAERARQTVAEAAPQPVVTQAAASQPILPPRALALAAVQAEPTPVPPPRPQTRGLQQLELSAVRPVAASLSPFASRWSIGAQPAAIAPSGRVIRPPANVDSTSSLSRGRPTDEDADAALASVVPETAKPTTAPARTAAANQSVVAKAEPTKIEPTKADPIKLQLLKAEPAKAAAARTEPSVRPGTGWVIQLGATDDEGKAKSILSEARAKSNALSDASGFTEKVEKGGSTLFRARFAGFDDSKDANDACNRLKRNGFSCFATRG
jgi:D-alanyl-D-alanine carboxypeptidase